MFYYVLLVLIASTIAIGYFAFNGSKVKFIRKIGYETARRAFVFFGMIFMIVSMMVSKLTNDSLSFSFFGVYFADEYSTLIWAIVYFVILYVSIFEEFHLNGWITSKSKSWKKIDEAQLNYINQLVIKDVLNGNLEKNIIFLNAIYTLNVLQEDIVMIGYTKTDFFLKEFCGVYYHCKDERIDMFVDGIIDIIKLKSN